MNGDPDHNIKLLPSLVQSLLDCGHYAAVTTINPEEMRAIMTANAQSNYDLAVKAAKKLAEAQAKKGSEEPVAMPVRADFEPNYAKLEEDGEYFEAWFFAPSPSIRQMRRGMLLNVSTMDAGHDKSRGDCKCTNPNPNPRPTFDVNMQPTPFPSDGTFYASYTYDSNSQLVLLLAMHCLYNESIRAWKMFCSRLRHIYNFEWTDQESEDEDEGEGGGGGGGEGGTQVHPHRIDSDEKVMIADGHAAIAAMFAGEHAVFEELRRALCMDHRKDHAGARGGSSGNYRTMCCATTSDSFWSTFEKSEPQFQNFVAEEDLDAQFRFIMMVKNGVSMHGRTCSSGSESMMGANLMRGIRELGHDPYRGLYKLVLEELRRFEERRAASRKQWRGQPPNQQLVVMPESVRKYFEEMENKPDYLNMRSASRMGSSSSGPVGAVRVTCAGSSGSVQGTSTVVTYLNQPKCECGIPQVDLKVCKHQHYAAKQLGVPVEELLQAFDTVGHWRAQYAGRMGDFRLPGTASLDGSGVRLLRALSGPVKSGAPSRKRNVGANRAARDALKKRHAAS